MSTTAIPSTHDRVATWLRLDAAFSGAAGLLLAAGAPWLDGELGAPSAFLVPLGIFLLAYAGGLVALTRLGAPTPAVLVVIAGNALWVLLSVVTLAADWLTLSDAGNVLALAQAGVVALLAVLQLAAVRAR
jgi:hypothetical protein